MLMSESYCQETEGKNIESRYAVFGTRFYMSKFVRRKYDKHM